MSLIVETGTGVPGAESYLSVADADQYFSDRGNAAWAALDTGAKEQALRKATDYMEATYGTRWVGKKLHDSDPLSWPRTGFTGIPEPVRRANAELAVRASTGALLPDASQGVKSKTVGPLSVTYMDGSSASPSYSFVDAMLSSLLSGGGGIGQARVIRA